MDIEPLDRLEFAFVLLPEDTILGQLHSMAQNIYQVLQHASRREKIPEAWGSYYNHAPRIPHLSVGQYGMLGSEFEILKNIIKEVSVMNSPIQQAMNKTLSVLDDHVFFDSKECFEDVNPQILHLYVKLREHYMERIYTRFPIKQAVFAKKHFAEQPDELELIEKHFQNWGTPEKKRMRPHFTMHYHPPFESESAQDILKSNKVLTQQLASLSRIKLTRLGIIAIDTFGNPLDNGLLFVCPLSAKK